MQADTGLVYLLRARNGVEPFRNFLDAYRAHPPGAPHVLLLLAKGFDGALPVPYTEALGALRPRVVYLPDRGFDLGPYHHAVRATAHEYLCFVNSFTRPRAEGWLAALREAAAPRDVGAAGATGSLESVVTNLARMRAALPMPRQTARWLSLRAREALNRAEFREFPNAHLRTNGFIARRETLLRLRWPEFFFKRDTLRFESGRAGLSSQLLARGLGILVVGRDGRSFEPGAWGVSGTFRQGSQTNLLLADNQTDAFASATEEQRAELATRAWGEQTGR